MIKSEMISKENAIVGRDEEVYITGTHFVNGNKITPPFASELETAYFGMGCFWGAERIFWRLNGVVATAVGYQGGYTKNPTYSEVCSGATGHTEAVLVVFDPTKISYYDLVKTFWESHDPTQGMRQGNDRGTQYRSAIYCSTEDQLVIANETQKEFQSVLGEKIVTTEIGMAKDFYYAEEYHQQYLAKNPDGYCGIGGTGFCLPPKK